MTLAANRAPRTLQQCSPAWQRSHSNKVASRRVRVQSSTAITNTDKDKLLALIAKTQRGVATTPDELKSIAEVVDRFQASAATMTTTTQNLSSTWELLWTTEKETLFILKTASWFGTQAGAVYQVIDLDSKLLQNVITFPPEGAFIVNAAISVAGQQRVDFKFEDATFKVSGKSYTVPPFGQGWFDTVYMDDELRIAKDIRGDTLIVKRDGKPRVFK